jgi:hypothetical protein
MDAQEIEFGLDTPVYVTVDDSGQPIDSDVVIRNTIEEAVLAEVMDVTVRRALRRSRRTGHRRSTTTSLRPVRRSG